VFKLEGARVQASSALMGMRHAHALLLCVCPVLVHWHPAHMAAFLLMHQ